VLGVADHGQSGEAQMSNRVLFAELEVDAAELKNRWENEQWAITLAWHRWRVASCVEFNGGHDLRLRSEWGSSPELACAHGCPVDVDDFYPDGYSLLSYDLPVTIQTETVHYPATPDHGDEWDSWVWLEARDG
jgi:hypothetical protein